MNMDHILMNNITRPKSVYTKIYNFIDDNLYSTEYEKVVNGFKNLHDIHQKHYVLELYDPVYRSLESYCFSLYKDKTGIYTIYNNKIKHFHNVNNAIKYQCAKHIVDSKLSCESMTYMCLENSIINKKESFKEYIDRAYSMKKRVFINGKARTN